MSAARGRVHRCLDFLVFFSFLLLSPPLVVVPLRAAVVWSDDLLLGLSGLWSGYALLCGVGAEFDGAVAVASGGVAVEGLGPDASGWIGVAIFGSGGLGAGGVIGLGAAGGRWIPGVS